MQRPQLSPPLPWAESVMIPTLVWLAQCLIDLFLLFPLLCHPRARLQASPGMGLGPQIALRSQQPQTLCRNISSLQSWMEVDACTKHACKDYFKQFHCPKRQAFSILRGTSCTRLWLQPGVPGTSIACGQRLGWARWAAIRALMCTVPKRVLPVLWLFRTQPLKERGESDTQMLLRQKRKGSVRFSSMQLVCCLDFSQVGRRTEEGSCGTVQCWHWGQVLDGLCPPYPWYLGVIWEAPWLEVNVECTGVRD